MAPLELGVLVSGTGTNLQAILDAIGSARLDARVRLVLSNIDGAQALPRAQAAGVPTRVLSHRDFSKRKDFEEALVRELEQAGVQWVVLAGFMRVLGATFLQAYAGRIINIHPSLLPAFPGLDAQAQALASGVRITGCTVHFVDEGTDTGPIIAQAAVPVLSGDTRDALAARILVREHELLVAVLSWLAQGRVRLVPGASGARPQVIVDGVQPFIGLAETL